MSENKVDVAELQYDAELRDWSMVDHGDDLRIHGAIYGDGLTSGKHPFEDGFRVVTSTVRGVYCGVAVTRSGTRYKLQADPSLLDRLVQSQREVEGLKADVRVAYGFDKDAVFANVDRLTAQVTQLRGALVTIAALEPVTDQSTGCVDDAAQTTARQALQGE